MIVRSHKTVADYMRLPDQPRMELIDGEFYVSPSPNIVHQEILLRLASLLRAFAGPRNLGKVVVAPFDCILSDESVVQPDVLFVARGHLDRIQERLHGAPDVATEIISPSHAERDRIVKRDLYLRHGVSEYWIIDPTEWVVEVFEHGGTAWKPHGAYAVGEALTSTVLTDLRVDARAVFED